MTRLEAIHPHTIAHRGLSAHFPENTLTAVRGAYRCGCPWVELDVQLLGDGTPVIWHDPGVRRCSSRRGKLFTFDMTTAKTLDVGAWFHPRFAGERMATLEEMLDLINELGLGLNLELKVNRGRDPRTLTETSLPMALDKLPTERLVVSSFNRQALHTARQLEPDPHRLNLGLLYDKLPKEWREIASHLNAYSFHLDWRRLKEKQAREIKATGYRLFCYTANDPIAFAPLWQWGVDAVISDDPDLFAHYLPGKAAT
ncbi:glycerophosphodiester phosphodiesterase family protein [Aidingimonas halophila]|uniref:Glycerophosphoryl diester phosphodiesterase n=1 Tax=Aidingimonas halophila TaxID=574349 RepID=A0A1H3EX26_9GAMM|nr:glycerophosphodiester phosphodiesterase family protein [Aidingimonas halophila]GHC31901.1 glycerophosphoryl diester phosphodiesterase [Aidingimonas halophila]SDX83316.1 glycerophosphoryl diester phosphodiesterase [Aidingimonas halophila]